MNRVFVALALLFLAACSSGGEHVMNGPATPLAASYESVQLVINAKAPDSSEIVPDLRSAVMGQLLSTGRFKRVASADEHADVVVTVDVIDYQRVTTAERILAGTLAGRNRIATSVSVTDGHSAAVIRSYQASGKSAAHPLSSESGYADALREVSKEIILGLSA